ncbi:TolC family protein [Anaeromyxobacter diazotrophicus]|nr:TolC family protein [Anaeromyxobacter diazotrophicus]
MTSLRAALLGSAAALLGTVALADAPAPPRALSLEDALAELEHQSPSLEQARQRREQAAGLARQALAAALPTLTASGSYVRNSDAATAPIGRLLSALQPGAPAPPDLVIQPREAFGANGTLRVPLVAPSAWADVAAARSAERAAGESAEAARLELRAALVQAAWSAAAGDEVVAASERAVGSADDQTRLAERALAAGTGVPLAVLQARTEAVKRRSDLARARADRARAELAAGVLLGRAEPVRIAVPAARPPAALDPRALAEEAEGHRPEVRALAAQVEAAEHDRASARLRLLPQLSASASAFAQTVPYPTGKEEGWRVTVDLTWPLYDGGLRYGKARQAEGRLAEASAALAAQRVAIAQEVDDAARDVGLAVERLALAEEQARLAGEAAATARRGFAGGVASSLDVLDANDRLFQSEVGLAQARARLGLALAAVDRATGRS